LERNKGPGNKTNCLAEGKRKGKKGDPSSYRKKKKKKREHQEGGPSENGRMYQNKKKGGVPT